MASNHPLMERFNDEIPWGTLHSSYQDSMALEHNMTEAEYM